MRGAKCAHRRRRPAADRRRDLRHQPLRQGARGVPAPCATRWPRCLADSARRVRRGLSSDGHSSAAHPLLGHARLAAGGADRRRRARASSSPRCAAASGRTFESDDEIERYVDSLPFDVAGTFGGHTSCVEIETGASGLRGLRPRQRPAAVRPGGDRAARARRRRRPITCSCRTCTGTTSWACRSSGRPTSRATALVLLRRASRARSGAAAAEGAAVVSGRFLGVQRATSSSCTSSPARRTTSPACSVTVKRQHHAGDSYGYRFERDGRAVVYSTDSEHTLEDPSESAALRRVLPQRRRRDLRCDVLARRGDLGQGRLGPFEQHRRRRAVPARRGAAPVPVPSRAGARRRGASTMLEETRRYEEITRTGEPLRVSAAYDGLELTL